MEIRKARMEDIESLVEIGRRGHAASENAAFEFDEGRAKLMGAQCICNNRMCAFVAVKEGNIVGLLLGHEEQYGYIKMRFATDLVTYAEAPGAGKLLVSRFMKWAFEERKVDQLLLGVTYGGKSERGADALYKRLGFTRVGGLFTKEVPK